MNAPETTISDERVASAGRVVRAEFTGSAGEYFRIWIVNLFFTLVTLGVYSAWAKVRKKRYFYGSTRFDGDSFDYFASPKAILKGRLVAAAIFVAYALGTELYPVAGLAFWAVAVPALPWLVVRALGFNARNSAYRGLRFDFAATTWEAARRFAGMVALMIVTLGLAWPWFVARYKAFMLSRHAFGASRFECQLPARAFYGIYLKAGLVVLAVGAPLAFVLAFAFSLAIARSESLQALAPLALLLPVAGGYIGYAVAYAYVQARTTNLQWAGTRGPGVRFESTLRARRLSTLYIQNFLAVAATAGLLIPWAVVRTLRYRLEHFAMIVDDAVVHEANPALAPVGAAGQELGDFFNMDLGL